MTSDVPPVFLVFPDLPVYRPPSKGCRWSPCSTTSPARWSTRCCPLSSLAAWGGGPLVLGLLDGAAELTSSVVKWVSGRLADRPGWRRPLILWGYATAVLVRPLISMANSAWQVVGFRVIDRLGKGIRTPPRDALIAEVTPPPLRGRAFGFHRGADHFGAVLGSLAAWVLLSRGADVRSVIGWSALPGVVAFVVLAVVLRSRGSGVTSQRVTSHQPAADHDSRLATGDWRILLAPSLGPDRPHLLPASGNSPHPPASGSRGGGRRRSPGLGRAPRRAERQLLPGRLALGPAGAAPVVAAGGLLFAVVVFALGAAFGPAEAIALFP